MERYTLLVIVWKNNLFKMMAKRAFSLAKSDSICTLLFSCFVLIIILMGCEKEFDYLNKYDGKFQFHLRNLSAPFGPSDVVDSFDYAGHIYVAKEGAMDLHYLESSFISINVDKEGKISGLFDTESRATTGEFLNWKTITFCIHNYDQLGREFARTCVDGERR